MLYIVYQEDVEDSAGLREIHKPAHFAYLDQWKDKLVLGGAMMPDDGNGRIGSVLILNVESREEVEAFSANEPLRVAGVLSSKPTPRRWCSAFAPLEFSPTLIGVVSFSNEWCQSIVPKAASPARPAMINAVRHDAHCAIHAI
ncbi:MAG: hypothetical protein HOI95_09780, partial [Chromatiales bacterium]|nr:hypothetical protein [Chromatiales bacterium]